MVFPKTGDAPADNELDWSEVFVSKLTGALFVSTLLFGEKTNQDVIPIPRQSTPTSETVMVLFMHKLKYLFYCTMECLLGKHEQVRPNEVPLVS